MTNSSFQVSPSQVPLVRTMEPKVGDWFVATWGYDQTNKSWFRVEKVSASGKSVYVREYGSKRVGSQGIDDIVVPDPDSPRLSWNWVKTGEVDEHGYEKVEQAQFVPEPKRHTLKWSGEGRPYFKWADFRGGYASLWNGVPQRETNALFGH